MHPSHAKNHQKLSGAEKIEDHTLEMDNYQQMMNHLIKRMHAGHGQIHLFTVSLRIVRG